MNRVSAGLVGAAIFAAASGARPEAAATPACEPVLRLDGQGKPRDGEATLRAETGRAVACESARRPPDYEAIARHTELYLRHSSTPACELMVIDDHTNIRLARHSAVARDRHERWRRAWDMLSAVSLAWARAPTARVPDLILARCVRPARDTLSQFPALTVSVEPHDAAGYQLFWDGVARERSLPRIMPGKHALDLVPPEGHATTLSIDEVPVLRRHEGVVHRDIDLRWTQRMRMTITFEPLSSHESGVAARGTLLDERSAGESPALLWGGAAALALGVGGITVSALRAASFEERATRLYDRSQCPIGADCARGEIMANWSAADDWRHWGYTISGVVAAAGVAGIAAYFLLDGGTEQGAAQASARIQVRPYHLGATLHVRF